MTEQHKLIYNLYLKYLAIKNNRPYKARENFDDLPEDRKSALIKLGLFFDRNPEINKELYFKVGFNSVPHTFLNLEYFYHISVIKNYNKFIRQYYNLSVEEPEVINDFVEGLKFIVSFVRDNKIKLKEYPNFCNENGIKYALVHLKQRHINLYHFHCFNISFSDINLGDEILNIYLEDFKNKFFETKRQYLTSNKIQTIGYKIKQQIEK